MADNEPAADRPTDEFVRMFAASEREIQRYILMFVPNETDALEVFQETCVILWRKFQPMPSERDFTAWACRVAHFEVLKHRKRMGKSQLMFDDDVINLVSDDRLEMAGPLEARRGALARCLEKLSARDRELIEHRYAGKTTSKQVAAELNRPANTVYKALERIRRQLFECVNRALDAEERPA